MAKHHKLELTEGEIQALVDLRDKGEPAYLRERATALLKIHEGFSPHEVARRGLLKKRDPDTVYAWLRRYLSLANTVFAGCLINLVEVANLLFHLSRPKKPGRNS